MRKYNYNEVDALLKEKGLSLRDISRALSISKDDVCRYLCDGERIACQDMIRIDAVIDVLKKVTPHRPCFTAIANQIQFYKLAEEVYGEILQEFYDNLRTSTELEAQHREEKAIDEICFVIGFSNPDMTTIQYDPDEDYIKGWSVDEFKRRILERVRLD